MVVSKTVNGNSIVSYDTIDKELFQLLPDFNDTLCILNYGECAESEITTFTDQALKVLPVTKNILICHLDEAFNSTYWNIVFEKIYRLGYKKLLFIDGGLTPPYIFNDLIPLAISHTTSTTFFTEFNNTRLGYEAFPKIYNREYYYLSLGRYARKERIYFTKKLLNSKFLRDKGIYSCGWTKYDALNIWESKSYYTSTNIGSLLTPLEQKLFPVSLNHREDQQHEAIESFKLAIFNIVQEASIGFDTRSSDKTYSKINIDWCRSTSDRIFFTEKSAKPFLLCQLPLFIAAPGYVDTLRQLGFDVFDDILDHSYDKEDNINKRCDLVFKELKRLVKLHTITEWNLILNSKLKPRLEHNFHHIERVGNINDKVQWVIDNLFKTL